MDPIKYYFIRGPVRGRWHTKHRSEDRAHLAVLADRRACKRLGGYSDARVYAAHDSGSVTGPYPFPDHLLDRIRA